MVLAAYVMFGITLKKGEFTFNRVIICECTLAIFYGLNGGIDFSLE